VFLSRPSRSHGQDRLGPSPLNSRPKLRGRSLWASPLRSRPTIPHGRGDRGRLTPLVQGVSGNVSVVGTYFAVPVVLGANGSSACYLGLDVPVESGHPHASFIILAKKGLPMSRALLPGIAAALGFGVTVGYLWPGGPWALVIALSFLLLTAWRRWVPGLWLDRFVPGDRLRSTRGAPARTRAPAFTPSGMQRRGGGPP